METTLTLPLDPRFFWGFVGLVAILSASFFVYFVLYSVNKTGPSASPLQRRLGLDALPPALFLLATALWGLLTILLATGLFLIIFDVVFHSFPDHESPLSRFWDRITGSPAAWDFRFRIAQLTSLTAVLGAAIALPMTLHRLRLSSEQTKIATDSLFNDKISEATESLYAKHQVSIHDQEKGWIDIWDHDVVRRIAAIDRLEWLVREDPREAGRLSRMLSAYVRELAREVPSKQAPKGDIQKVAAWSGALETARSDIQAAVQVLGRLAKVPGIDPEAIDLDLRGANLQGCDLRELTFQNATFERAEMHGVNLERADLGGVDFEEARLGGAIFRNAKLNKCNFKGAQLQSVDLTGAELKGAYFREAQLQGADFSETDLSGAVDLNSAQL